MSCKHLYSNTFPALVQEIFVPFAPEIFARGQRPGNHTLTEPNKGFPTREALFVHCEGSGRLHCLVLLHTGGFFAVCHLFEDKQRGYRKHRANKQQDKRILYKP